MWRCLPFSSGNNELETAKKTTTLLRKKKSDAISGKIYVTEAEYKAAALEKMIRWHYTGVSLWFSYVFDYLGQAVLSYFHRLVDKIEKLEYYD